MRQQLEPDEERARVDALFVAIFEDDKRGSEIFDVLYKRFVSQAKVHTDGGIDAVLKTYRDAAYRQLIDYIVMRCNRTRGVDDEPTQETNDTRTQ